MSIGDMDSDIFARLGYFLVPELHCDRIMAEEDDLYYLQSGFDLNSLTVPRASARARPCQTDQQRHYRRTKQMNMNLE